MFRMKSLVAACVIVMLIFNLPAFNVYAQAAQNTMMNNFVDVDPQDPNLAFINYLSDREIIKGFSNGTYKPDGYLTRAQAAAIMVRALGISTQVPAKTKFTDVPVSHWAYEVIAASEREGLLKGFPDGTFRPNDRMTKAQSITLILKLLGEPVPEVTTPLPDDVPASHWAAKAIGTAYSAGLLEYHNNFTPDGFFTRADMAKVLSIAMTLSSATRNLPLSGELSATKGIVMVKKANETKFQTVTINKKIIVSPGDSIKTDTDSIAEIVFEDGSGLLLESNLQMTIKETQGLAYIGKKGKPGNTVNWLNIDLQKGKLFVFLASITPVEEIETDKEIPWWKGAQQDVIRVQVNMPLGIGTMKSGVGFFDARSYNSNMICNFIGQMNVTAQKQNIELRPAQIVSIFPDVNILEADDMREKDLREFVGEKIKTFLLMRSDRAITNQALEMFYRKGVKTPPVKQRENLLEALHKAEKASTSPSMGGGGGGGGGSGSDTLMQVSKVTAVPGSSAVTTGTEVSLNTATVEANIYYTLDESTPTTSSTQYTHPIIINANTTIKAIAVKSGMINSDVETFNYTIQGVIELSDDATLSNLTLSAGSLTPVFNPSITNYTVNVANVVTSTTVTATANSAKASIDRGGTQVVDLKVGENQITISVTAEDKTTKIYTIRIIRDAAQVDPPDLENSWIVVGERGFSEGEASLSSLYIANGIPYIAYKDKANGDKLTVKKYDGGTWLDVGEPGFTRGGIHTNSLLIDNGTPYIGYVDNYLNQRITVKKYANDKWMNVGNEGMTSSGSYDVSICLDKGILYVAYSDGSRSGRATVKKFENELWQDLGASGFSPREAHFISLRVDNGIPYIAFQDEWGGPVAVMKYNGSDWVNVGSPKLGAETAYGITLEIFNGIPYVAYQDGDKGPLIVKKFNEGSGDWVNVTQLTFSGDACAYGPSFKLVSPDSVYVVYRDGARGERATVQRYNGTSWNVVGDTGFTPYRVLELSIDVHENTPYVSFKESYDGITSNPIEGRISVMKYGVAESGVKTTMPIITSLPIKSGDMDIEGTAEPNSLIMMKRGSDTWDTLAQSDGSFVVSIGGDDKRLGAFDEVLITAQAPGKPISQAAAITVEYMGLGTVDNPYEIWTLGELNGIRHNLDAHYKLEDFIEAEETRTWNDGKGWEPIGNFGFPFTGTIDGNGLYIYDLFIDRIAESHIGLLGATDGAAISNLGLYVNTVRGGQCVGTLVGYNKNTSIDKCYAATTGSQGSVTGEYNIGGLVGVNVGASSVISECFAEVEVLGVDEADALGGLVGYNNLAGGIFNSYAIGDVTGNYYIGGLVGRNVVTSINNCYAAGVVTGIDVVGGLIGGSQDSKSSNSFALNSKIIRSEYTLSSFGKVIGDSSGANDITENIFALEQMQIPSLGVARGIHGADISFIEARKQSSYVGWDFKDIWLINEIGNPSYPHLRRIYNIAQNAGTGVNEAVMHELELELELESIDELEVESPVVEHEELVENVQKPIAAPEELYFEGLLEVFITTTTPGATIYYTLDGSEPTEENLIYDEVIYISETTIIKAIAVKLGMNRSDVLEVAYSLNKQ